MIALDRNIETGRPRLSVVIPVYGSPNTLTDLYRRLAAVLDDAVDGSFEILFVDDACPRNSWQVLEQIAAGDSRVGAIRLASNYGQHEAIWVGLSQSRGEWVAVMDCDLQDEPETLPDLIAAAGDSYDVVLTQRRGGYQPLWRRLVGRMFAATVRRLAGLPFKPGLGAYCLLSRHAVDTYLASRPPGRRTVLTIIGLGLSTTVIPYHRAARPEGTSSYSRRRLAEFGLDGLVYARRAIPWLLLSTAGGLAALGTIAGVAVLLGVAPATLSVVTAVLWVGTLIVAALGLVSWQVQHLLASNAARVVHRARAIRLPRSHAAPAPPSPDDGDGERQQDRDQEGVIRLPRRDTV